MAVILHRFSTEISSSGLGRRPLTAETRVRVPVSLLKTESSAFVLEACFFVDEPIPQILCRFFISCMKSMKSAEQFVFWMMVPTVGACMI